MCLVSQTFHDRSSYYFAFGRRKERFVSANDLYQKINIIELALKESGLDQALNAVIDALKEIAKRLDSLEKVTQKE
jgi:hypothetical protein